MYYLNILQKEQLSNLILTMFFFEIELSQYVEDFQRKECANECVGVRFQGCITYQFSSANETLTRSEVVTIFSIARIENV